MKRQQTLIQTLLDYQPLWRLCLVVSVIVILYLATSSQPYQVPSSPNDKVNHLIAFLELALLARLGWPRLGVMHLVPPLLGYGFAIELIQALLPYREFSLADMVADTVGIGIGLLPWPGIQRISTAPAPRN